MITAIFLGGSLILGTILLPIALDIALLYLVIKGISWLFGRRKKRE